MNKEKMFVARDEDGVECAYEMLLVKNVDNVPVIWYTDGKTDEDVAQNVYIAEYERVNNTFALNPINDESKMQKYEDIFTNEFND